MKTQFIVPRISDSELTYAAVSAEISEKAADGGASSANGFLKILKAAVTEWIMTTASGREAWNESSQDFNIGDLANENLDGVNSILFREHEVRITDIDVFSSDDNTTDEWNFDTVLSDPEML